MIRVIRILDLPLFSTEDLRCRWLLARVAALEKTLGLDHRAGGMSMEKINFYERELLAQIEEAQGTDLELKDSLLRLVFDHSRQLGISLVRYLNHSFELSDLVEILPELGSPCFTAKWKAHNQAFTLTRKGCTINIALNKSFQCDYWREALDGFVMGVGNDERLARHCSMGHGDSECQDVLFLESEGKAIGGVSASRWGALPEELAGHLKVQVQSLEQKGFKLLVHGYAEGKLYYEMKAKASGNCSPGERMMVDYFETRLTQMFPNLELAEISPQSVLDHKDS
jgi:hypothetical protein